MAEVMSPGPKNSVAMNPFYWSLANKSTVMIRQKISNLILTIVGDFAHDNSSIATPVPRFQLLINQQRLANGDVDMTINNSRMPALALKKNFRWIEISKPF
jgi:hypothetical protein